MLKKLLLLAILLVSLVNSVSAINTDFLDNDAEVEGLEEVGDMFGKVLTIIQFLAVGLGAIFLVINIGTLMTTNDMNKKLQAKNSIVGILIALAVVVAVPTLVKLALGVFA